MIEITRVPSFDTVLHNARYTFCYTVGGMLVTTH